MVFSMKNVLLENNKSIVHLRQQLTHKRLGVIMGAGASMGLGFPSWNDLIKGIAENPLTNGASLYKTIKNNVSQSSITEVLFHHFKINREMQLRQTTDYDEYFLQKRLLSDWREIIHTVLYSNVLENRQELVNSHPYLNELVTIIEKSEFSINYNFDDTIEFMIAQKSGNGKKPYQAIWETHAQYKTDTPIIYHPNGFLPADKNSQQSEELVFSEESFSDQLIDSMSGKTATILNLLSKKTCLLIGLSLDDVTLKHLLRQNAKMSPGNYHYYIRFSNKTGDNQLTDAEKNAIFNSNFAVYNLITLFFDNDDISNFLKLLSMDSSQFTTLADEIGAQIKLIYYFVGSVAVGKSSILSHFGNFQIVEEWIDDRPNLLTRPFNTLSPDEKTQVDTWINTQFKKKNDWLLDHKEGIFLVDRTPLDPLSFTNDDEQKEIRAHSMLNAIQPGASRREIISGHIIFLESDTKEQKGRLLTKRKLDWEQPFLQSLNKNTHELYENIISSHLNNMNKKIGDIINETAKIIFCNTYQEQNIHVCLKSHAKVE